MHSILLGRLAGVIPTCLGQKVESATPSLFIALRVSTLHVLIVSALFHLSGKLIVLRAASLLFYVLTRRLGFAVFEFGRFTFWDFDLP